MPAHPARAWTGRHAHDFLLRRRRRARPRTDGRRRIGLTDDDHALGRAAAKNEERCKASAGQRGEGEFRRDHLFDIRFIFPFRARRTFASFLSFSSFSAFQRFFYHGSIFTPRPNFDQKRISRFPLKFSKEAASTRSSLQSCALFSLFLFTESGKSAGELTGLMNAFLLLPASHQTPNAIPSRPNTQPELP